MKKNVSLNISPSLCRRGELHPNSLAPALDDQFLRDLRHFDRDVELYWNQGAGYWTLYRVLERCVLKSAEVLLKEFDIRGPYGGYRPVGPWLIRDMQERRMYHRMQNRDLWGLARDREVDRENEWFQRQREQAYKEVQLAQYEDMLYCKRGRVSIPTDPGLVLPASAAVNKRSGKKLIFAG